MDSARLAFEATLVGVTIRRGPFHRHDVVILGVVTGAANRADANALPVVEHCDCPAIQRSGPVAEFSLLRHDTRLRHTALPQFDIKVVADLGLSGDATEFVNLIVANDANHFDERLQG